MGFEHFIVQGTTKLRCGYTTGSCATLAAKAATIMLFTGEDVYQSSIMTPKGLRVEVDICEIQREAESIRCGVRKDGGDDCDATHGTMVYVTVSKVKCIGIQIDGGQGVGRVTQKGLNQPVGEAAINSTPRDMITKELEELCKEYQYQEGLQVVIDVPEGEEIAKKTFNPRLGIVGGISIIGTTGIVEPQSMKALVDTIETQMRMNHANNIKKLVITPGNYGENFISQYPVLQQMKQVKISNFLGESLDFGATYQYEEILLVGHIGKMVKVAGGIMNTHSRYADCRNEIFAAYTALCGGSQSVVREVMESMTTDSCIEILEREGLNEVVLTQIIEAAQRQLEGRVAGSYRIGILVFSNEYGLLGISQTGRELLDTWSETEQIEK